MLEQLPLSFSRPRPPVVEVAKLEDFLRGKGWLTRREISAATGWNERVVRELASTSDQVISFPGSPGYKLLGECTRDEYEDYRKARRSQARDMIGKVVRTDRIFYRRAPVEV